MSSDRWAPVCWLLGGRAALGLVLTAAVSGCALVAPSNHRDWSPDQAQLPRADIQLSHAGFAGDRIIVHNVRNCEYRTADDYTVHYYDKTCDLEQLDSADLIMVPFPGMAALAHTMLSFGFGGRDYLAVSAEVRRQRGDQYAPVKGSLDFFEMMYVLGDERDLLGLRTNHRLNEVFLYHTRLTPPQVRVMFVDVMHRVNQLAENPEAYNTFTNNCTTSIRSHVNKAVPNLLPYSWEVLLPGYFDRLAYDRGLLDTRLSFEETRSRAQITRQAYLYRDSDEFSVQIRR